MVWLTAGFVATAGKYKTLDLAKAAVKKIEESKITDEKIQKSIVKNDNSKYFKNFI
ncbi:hypothetical protein [Nostoc sp. FACHB-892]|uniref:hypothetical protein n=1 Tax=Nostoc sp. FACHB-892 TaxID=2692843 RepID=UPI001A7E8C82|nr:hypothetical protein [Nostoc sp. FACHB-892]